MKLNNNYRQIAYSCSLSLVAFFMTAFLIACGGKAADVSVASVDISQSSSNSRSNEIRVLTPVKGGVDIIGSEDTEVDYTNASEGYIVVNYSGDSSRVKFQIAGSNQVTYTYNLPLNTDTVIPLTSGSGTYELTSYVNIDGDQFAADFADTIDVSITNELGPYLYPNQYVNFTSDTAAVKKAAEVTADATCDLDAVSKVYDFVISTVTYDKEEAENVSTTYLPDVDEVMSTGKGICFDYASLMAAMLRSQGIPTRLEIGYAKDAYHAWISVYTEDQGWIGGVIQFNGINWTLMDPTLASNSKDIKKIKDFIGDGSSYTVKYMY